jgi:phosphatidylglycerol:prolipoprotein diacylglycerol transferase
MYPILFEIGDWPIYTYGVLLAAAYLAGLQLAVVRARRAGLDSTRIMDLGIYLIIAALVGAKLMLVVVEFDTFRNNPGDLFSLVRVGGVFYGGLIFAFVVGLILVRRYRLPVWATADMYAPGIALGHVIGRLGCLLAGCCYGRPADVPWAVTFTSEVARENAGTPLHEPLHPTQLYDAGGELIILAALLILERRSRGFAGRTFWLYILLYAISRFIVEAYRGDPRGEMIGLSTSQVVSIALVPVALLMLARLRRRATPTGGGHAAAATAAR